MKILAGLMSMKMTKVLHIALQHRHQKSKTRERLSELYAGFFFNLSPIRIKVIEMSLPSATRRSLRAAKHLVPYLLISFGLMRSTRRVEVAV